MKRNAFSCLVFAALFGAGMVSVTSCADYDEDINALQNQVNNLGSVQKTLQSQLDGMSAQIAALKGSLDAMKSCQCGDIDKKIADQIAKALSNGNYTTSAEVSDAINKALAGIQTGLTQNEIEALIKTYHDAHPGCSSADIENLIKKYLADNPGLSESDVEAIVKAYHDAHPSSTLSDKDVKSIVETYINQLQHFTKEQIEDMINTAITQALANYVEKNDVYTKRQVEDLIDAAVKNIKPGLSEDEVQALIDATIKYMKIGLSESEVQALIDNALKNIKPGLTETEIQALIDAALKNVKPGLTAEEVQALIDAAKCQCIDGLSTEQVTNIAVSVVEKYMKDHPYVLDSAAVENICNTVINNSQIINNLRSSISTLESTVQQVKNDLEELKNNVYTKKEVENLINTLIAQAISGLTPSGSLSVEQQAIITSLINTAISEYNADHSNCNCLYDAEAFNTLVDAVADNTEAIKHLQPKGDYVTNEQLLQAIQEVKNLIPTEANLSNYITIATYNQDLVNINKAIAAAESKAQQALNKANSNSNTLANLNKTVTDLNNLYINLGSKLDDTMQKAENALTLAQSNYDSIEGLREFYNKLLEKVELLESQGYDDTALKDRLNNVEDKLKTLQDQLNTLVTKDELTKQLDDVKKLVEQAKTYAENVANNAAKNALDQAKEYANGKYDDATKYADGVAATALQNAKDYADGKYTDAEKYADEKYVKALEEAKKLADGAYKNAEKYADKKYEEALKAAQDALNDAKKYADEQDKKTLADAETRAKELAKAAYEKALNDAKEIMYGEFKDNLEAFAKKEAQQALKDAKAYSDGKYEDAVAFAENKAQEALQAAKNYTDVAISNVTTAFEEADNLLQQQINTINNELVTINSTLTSLQMQIDDLTEMVDALSKFINNIELQGSVNPAFGYFALPMGITSNVLISYYGETNYDVHFPAIEDEGLVYKEGKNWITEEDAIRLGWNKPYILTYNGGSVLMNEDGNAGKLYLTLNPSNIDFTGTTLKLVNSLGEESPVKLGALKKSYDKLVFGQSRGAQTFFYEAPATLDESKRGTAAFHINKQLTDALEDVAKNKLKADISTLAQSIYNQFNGVLDAYAVQATWNDALGEHTVTSNYGIAATAAKPLSYSFLAGKSFEIPTITPLSERNIDLNDYIKLPDFSFDLGDLDFSIDEEFDVRVHFGDIWVSENGDFDFEGNWHEAGSIFTNCYMDEYIKGDGNIKDAPDHMHQQKFCLIDADGTFNSQIYDFEGGVNPAKDILSTEQQLAVNAMIALIVEDRAQVWSAQLQEGFERQLVDKIAKLITKINDTLENASMSISGDLSGKLQDMIDNANSKLNSALGKGDKFINQINKVINNVNSLIANPNSRLQSVVLYEDGNGTLHPMSTVKATPTFVSGDGAALELKLTSYSGEILAPAFKKFVAVTNVYRGSETADTNADLMKALNYANSKLNFNEVIDGDHYAVAFCPDKSVKGATYEIVYSALDFHGKISQRKYYVTVK